MEPFTSLTGPVAPLDRVNVDTDQIIPKQFLKLIQRTGFGKFLFNDWRYDKSGAPRPDFILNEPRYQGATILLTRANFGCGSSREHAVWALMEYGFRVIVAPSFADIFYGNCLKNGILAISISADQVERLFQEARNNNRYGLAVNLPDQTISTPSGDSIAFTIDPYRKKCLLEGLDEIGETLRFEQFIRKYEEKRFDFLASTDDTTTHFQLTPKRT